MATRVPNLNLMTRLVLDFFSDIRIYQSSNGAELGYTIPMQALTIGGILFTELVSFVAPVVVDVDKASKEKTL